MITKIIETIEKEYAGVVTSSRLFLPLPRDIDIYAPVSERTRVVDYLRREGFLCTEEAEICQARKFVGGECFFIDLAFGAERIRRRTNFFRKCLDFARRMGTGRIIAVVGPDGSGKTTVAQGLSTALFAAKMYMGDYALALQKFYDRLYKLPVALARVAYLFIYVENWFRYGRAFFLSRIMGKTVVVDRYPGLNQQMIRNNIWLKLNDFVYLFFPSADVYILVSAPPETIHARRRQLTVDEIARFQENIRLRLTKKKHFIEIENIDLDACLNGALRFIFK